MRKLPLILFLTLAALGAAGGAFYYFNQNATPPVSPDLPVSVYFTCDTNGRLEPCGCFSGQFGGLTRLKTFLEEYARPGAIKLDVGNALAGNADYQVIQYEYILRAYAAMNFDAVNIGHREATLPAATLTRLAAESPVPLISANLLDASTGQPLLPPWHLIERDGHRIAVVGLLDPRHLEDTLGEGLAVTSMRNTLVNLLPDLKQNADHIFVLAFTDVEEMQALAREFYEIDIILGGDVDQPSQDILVENNSLILFTTNNARTVGMLKGVLHENARFESTEFDVPLLKEHIPQDPDLIALTDDYRKEIRETVLDVDNPETSDDDSAIPGIHSELSYVGSQSCAACHTDDHSGWSKSGHAHAFESLAYRDSKADPNCLQCHTIGFGTKSGYLREYKDTKLAGVGCESCHGPGSAHVEQRLAGAASPTRFRPLGAADCTQCHHGEFSRPFDWDTFWPPVKHGEKSLTASILESP
jgi:2',3'-cyclic-nucleotide 2'-phosphodiesterase (5'-nucleotidase family)